MDKVLTAEEALKAFLQKAGAKPVDVGGNYNPIIRLVNNDGQKFFLQGVLLRKRETKSSFDESKMQEIFTFKLAATNAPVTTKNPKTKEYDAVPFSNGMEVDLFSTSDLSRQLKNVAPGAEVFISYIGKVAKKTKQGKTIMPHTFKVVEVASTAVDDVSEALEG